MPGPSLGVGDSVPTLDLAVVEDAAALRRPWVRSYVEHLSPSDICEMDGLRVTTPVRTAADLGRWLPTYDAIIRSVGWTIIVLRRGDLERPQRLVDAVGMFVSPVRPPRSGLGGRNGLSGAPSALARGAISA